LENNTKYTQKYPWIHTSIDKWLNKWINEKRKSIMHTKEPQLIKKYST
jgi:hypothetical protein